MYLIRILIAESITADINQWKCSGESLLSKYFTAQKGLGCLKEASSQKLKTSTNSSVISSATNNNTNHYIIVSSSKISNFATSSGLKLYQASPNYCDASSLVHPEKLGQLPGNQGSLFSKGKPKVERLITKTQKW